MPGVRRAVYPFTAPERTPLKRLNTLWNAMSHDNLPACVKYVQHRQGLGFYAPRAPMQPVTAAQKTAIDAALNALPLKLSGVSSAKSAA
jgi:4-hydroxy-tetrahydrodipicolinate synthase